MLMITQDSQWTLLSYIYTHFFILGTRWNLFPFSRKNAMYIWICITIKLNLCTYIIYKKSILYSDATFEKLSFLESISIYAFFAFYQWNFFFGLRNIDRMKAFFRYHAICKNWKDLTITRSQSCILCMIHLWLQFRSVFVSDMQRFRFHISLFLSYFYK